MRLLAWVASVRVQDGDSSHTSNIVTEWFTTQDFDLLGDWPANSPDLSLIENVWGMMVRKLALRDIQTVEQLKEAITEEWDAIDYEKIRALYDSVRKRYSDCIELNGDKTKY